MKRYIFILFLFMAFIVQAQVYKWTDSSGNVHFSDKPHPGAEKVDLPEVQTFSAPAAAASTNDNIAAVSDEENSGYKKVQIIQPKDQETIRNNQGFISVVVDMDPILRTGDKLQLLFDGAALGPPQLAPAFAIKDVNRGSHTLAVEVINNDANVIVTSETITVFMHRPRVGMGSEGGAQR